MSNKKEFKVGDEVWFCLNSLIISGIIDRVELGGAFIVLKPPSDTAIYPLHSGVESMFFHTPEELLENIKQQIDDIQRNKG